MDTPDHNPPTNVVIPRSTDSKIELFSDEDVHMSPRRLVQTLTNHTAPSTLNSSQTGTTDNIIPLSSSSQTDIINSTSILLHENSSSSSSNNHHPSSSSSSSSSSVIMMMKKHTDSTILRSVNTNSTLDSNSSSKVITGTYPSSGVVHPTHSSVPNFGSDTDDGPIPLQKLLPSSSSFRTTGGLPNNPGRLPTLITSRTNPASSSPSNNNTGIRLPPPLSVPISGGDGFSLSSSTTANDRGLGTPNSTNRANMRLNSFRYTGNARSGSSIPQSTKPFTSGIHSGNYGGSSISTTTTTTLVEPTNEDGTMVMEESLLSLPPVTQEPTEENSIPFGMGKTVGSVSSLSSSHPSVIADKLRNINRSTTVEMVYRNDPPVLPSLPTKQGEKNNTEGSTPTVTESEQEKKAKLWKETYFAQNGSNKNTTVDVELYDINDNADGMMTSDSDNSNNSFGNRGRLLGKKRLAAEKAKLTAELLETESWTDTKIIVKPKGNNRTATTNKTSIANNKGKNHETSTISRTGRPSRAAAVNARTRGFLVADDDEGSFEEEATDDSDTRKRRSGKDKKKTGVHFQDENEAEGEFMDDEDGDDDLDGDDDDGSGSYQGSDNSDSNDNDDEDEDNENENELGPPGIGSIGTTTIKISKADIEKLTQQAACLRHLKRGDRYRFAALWKKAHDIAGRLESAILMAHGVKKENGETTNGSSSTTSTSSLSGSSLVTGDMLTSVLGWGGVTTASAIASSGRAGTSSANDKVSESIVSPSRNASNSVGSNTGLIEITNASSSVSSSLSLTKDTVPPTGSGTNLTLTPFQLVGLNWLLLLHRECLNGVLADEMGLGKSIQTLALLEWLRVTTNFTGPHLIVTPASTVSNWIRETKKWAPQLRIRSYRGGLNRSLIQKKLMYGGGDDEEEDNLDEGNDDEDEGKGGKRRTKKKRSGSDDSESSEPSSDEDDDDENESIIDAEDEDDIAQFRSSGDTPRSFDILVTTYTLFDRQGATAAADRIFLRRYKWEYIICDEGHSLKNANGHRFRQLNTLQGDHRLLLSGTPIQNSIPELFSLLRFLEPQLFTRRIESIFTEDSKKKANLTSRVEKARLADLRRVLQPFILRRSKADVLRDLPSKTDETIALPMPTVHASQYAQVVELLRNQVMGKKSSANINSALHANPMEGLASVSSSTSGSRPNRAAARKAADAISSTSIQQENVSVDQSTTGNGKRKRGKDAKETPVNSENSTPIVITAQASYGTERSMVRPVDISIDSTDTVTPNGNTSITSSTVSASSIPDNNPVVTPVQGEDLAILRKASTKLSKTAANSLFGDLRKVSQHPLLLRGWYSHLPTLEGIADALYHEGAFGFNSGCNPARVLVELEESSDWEIFDFCLHYGYTSAELQKKQSILEVCKGKIKPEDGLRPIKLLPNFTLSGTALLRAAVEALPMWAIENSAKLQYLKTWVPEQLKNGHRILIFSQLMATLSIISTCLQAWGIKWLRLDGSTPVEDRQSLLDVFTEDSSYGVFLLSTKAGGLGLNLTAADTVILHDSDWNPHADAQAIDRAHRLGQTRPVRVQRLVTAGSLDERMARIAQLKLDLDRALRTDSSGVYNDKKNDTDKNNNKGLTLNVNELLLEILSGGSIPMKETVEK